MTLLRGTVDLLVLKALGADARHGMGIARWVEDETGGILTLGEGTLYPALERLERNGWISGRWGRSENNRRARFYEVTTAGRHRSRREACRWRSYSLAMERVVGLSDDQTPGLAETECST